MANKKHIIIKKVKKKGKHAHHGGAWKIAYADFVTAMMAFFLLMWLISSSTKEQLEGLSEYFTPTLGMEGVPFKSPGKPSKNTAMDRSSVYGSIISPSEITETKEPNNIDQQNFSNILSRMKEVNSSMDHQEDFLKRIMIDMTPEGLRIQLFDDLQRPLFQPGTDKLMPYTEKILNNIVKVIAIIPNFISIGGHTRVGAEQSVENANKWIISSKRAVSVRDYITSSGISNEKIARVVGYADHNLYLPKDPQNIKNMRISIILLKSDIAGSINSSSPMKILKSGN